MSRLIDADALKELRHDIIQGSIKFDGNEYNMIDKCPTIDAVVVVHGQWEKVPPYTSLGGEYKKALICSECHSFFVSDGNKPWQLHNYCPNCGAKMDGERREL